MSALWNFYENLRCTISLADFIISLFTPMRGQIVGICFLAPLFVLLFIFKEFVIHLEKNLHFVETSSFLYKREGVCYKYLFHNRT